VESNSRQTKPKITIETIPGRKTIARKALLNLRGKYHRAKANMKLNNICKIVVEIVNITVFLKDNQNR
jgi:hypothetical protein